jgi:arginine deiminase
VAVETPLREVPLAGGGVESEVGVLRRVLVHRPGRELARLTPGNKDELLFDEVPWLGPLPNHLFTRDSSAWIGERAHVSEMALPSRRREVAHLAAVYRHHPRFRHGPSPFLAPAPLEGGDVLVLAPGRVLVGVGERTSPAAVERLALELTERDPRFEVLVAALPPQRATMHLDTVLTMVDRDAFTVYPEVAQTTSTFRLRRTGTGLGIDAAGDLRGALRL